MNRTILIFLIAIAIAGCNKAKTTVERTTAAYDFSWTDVPLPGVPTYADLHKFAFVTTAPVGSTTIWNFGDGIVSSDFAPEHTYTGTGARTVSLIINGDTAHMLTKTLNIYAYLPHSITWSGAALVDSTLVFRSNVLPDSSFLWDFGDGTTSADSIPAHVYRATGTYSVRLTVNGNTSLSVVRSVPVITAPAHTYLIAGTRLWHDTSYLYTSSALTAYPNPDVFFALTYINPITIAYKGRVMNYAPVYSNDSLLYFSGSYTNTYGKTSTLSLKFFPYTDSIWMEQYNSVSAGGSTIERWITH